jgi:hypothetical protein
MIFSNHGSLNRWSYFLKWAAVNQQHTVHCDTVHCDACYDSVLDEPECKKDLPEISSCIWTTSFNM